MSESAFIRAANDDGSSISGLGIGWALVVGLELVRMGHRQEPSQVTVAGGRDLVKLRGVFWNGHTSKFQMLSEC